jgi:hypothetical protein
MKPRFCSSRSRTSAKGSAVFARSSASSVYFDGALPFRMEMAGERRCCGLGASRALAEE